VFFLCSACDRGRRYCGAVCSRRARTESMREAGRRYQRTRDGRLAHAARQAAWRQRQKVTHQSPPRGAPEATVVGEPAPSAMEADAEANTCRHSGRPHTTKRSASTTLLRAPASGAAPQSALPLPHRLAPLTHQGAPPRRALQPLLVGLPSFQDTRDRRLHRRTLPLSTSRPNPSQEVVLKSGNSRRLMTRNPRFLVTINTHQVRGVAGSAGTKTGLMPLPACAALAVAPGLHGRTCE